MLKHILFSLLMLLAVIPLLAQIPNPTVEIVLSTDQAQQGETIYADVIIHNGHAIAGADIGITTDSCLRLTDRESGNYLPTTTENGGFSPFAELSDHGTRFAASVTDRLRVANGDGTFFRAVMQVTCAEAVPNVKVTFAQLAALAYPSTERNELLGLSLEQESLSVVNDSLTVRQGAVASTPTRIERIPPSITVTNQNLLLYVALTVLVFSLLGMIVLLIVYRRQLRNPKRS